MSLSLVLEDNIDEESKDPYDVVPDYFAKRVFKNCIRDIMQNGSIKAPKYIDYNNVLVPLITFQMYYDYETNKCFMEYDFPESLNHYCNRTNLITAINGFIGANMYYDLNIVPEIIMYEDGVNERCDDNDNLSPYVVGYWLSLNGRLEFIEDEVHIITDMRQFDRALFDTKIKEFFTITENIRKKYVQTELTEEQKTSYIKEAEQIWLDYHDDMDTYNQKIKDLNTKYSVKNKRNEDIPAMYEEFATAYNDFFGRELSDAYNETKRYRYKIYYTE